MNLQWWLERCYKKSTNLPLILMLSWHRKWQCVLNNLSILCCGPWHCIHWSIYWNKIFPNKYTSRKNKQIYQQQIMGANKIRGTTKNFFLKKFRNGQEIISKKIHILYFYFFYFLLVQDSITTPRLITQWEHSTIVHRKCFQLHFRFFVLIFALGHDITSIGQFIETKFSPTNTLQGKISKFINNKSWVQTRLGVPLRILIFLNLGMVKKLFLKKSHIVFLFLFFLLVQHLDTSPRLITQWERSTIVHRKCLQLHS